jgi:nucleoside-diphosphate-sugar epimerase
VQARSKILITGPTGQVARPVAEALARDGHEVWGIARFKDGAARADLEELGVHTRPVNLVDGDFTSLPDDFDYVLNFAVVKSWSDRGFDRDLAANVEALGLLMAHCRAARAFLHCSSTAVYQPNGQHRFTEADPLGDHHRTLFPTYSISKIAAEAMARYGARQWHLPTTIARLNTPYGDNGGWPAFHLEMLLAGDPVPVHPDGSVYNLIHEDDIMATIPALLDAARVPATIVNWAGDQTVAIAEWCQELGALTGLPVKLVEDPGALASVAVDVTRLQDLLAAAGPGGAGFVDWRDGLRRLVRARHPELLPPQMPREP